MKTGDIVTDSRAAAWTLETLLGEGSWGRAWAVRDDANRLRVLKAPYEAEDLPPASADRVPLMRAVAIEQAELLAEGHAHLIPLEDRITLPTGAVALLLPHTPTTLARQIASGIPLVEALEEVFLVAESLASVRMEHGNLRPTNILIDNDGRPLLTDPLTPTLRTLQPGAERSQPARKRWAAADRIATDTWALCSALYTAILLDERAAEGAPSQPEPPRTGLDKLALADLKDHAIARLRRDGANPRFIHRTADRLSTLLARGLSAQADPSPPYRFLTAGDLKPRIAEVNALIRPGIESVGRLLLASNASGDVFDAPGPVGFTVSVGPTSGINDPDDLVCGVRLTDLDAAGDGRVPLADAQFAVNRHPSGRLRFEFNIPEVAPGRYSVRVAFSIKDSGDDPAIAAGSFQVRPQAGWVPPAVEPEAPPTLAFPAGLNLQAGLDDDENDDDDDAATVLMKLPNLDTDADENNTDPDDGTDAGTGELIQAFPRPLAPTAPGTLIDEQPEPISAPLVSSPAPQPILPTPSAILAAVPTPPPSEYTDSGPSDTVTAALPPPTPRVMPSLVPTPSPAPGPSLAPSPSIGMPTPGLQPTPSPLGAESPEWQASQAHEAEFFQPEGGLPGGGEDLMGASPSLLDQLQDRFGDFARPDSPKFFGAAIAGCLLLIVVMFALLRAC